MRRHWYALALTATLCVAPLACRQNARPETVSAAPAGPEIAVEGDASQGSVTARVGDQPITLPYASDEEKGITAGALGLKPPPQARRQKGETVRSTINTGQSGTPAPLVLQAATYISTKPPDEVLAFYEKEYGEALKDLSGASQANLGVTFEQASNLQAVRFLLVDGAVCQISLDSDPGGSGTRVILSKWAEAPQDLVDGLKALLAPDEPAKGQP